MRKAFAVTAAAAVLLGSAVAAAPAHAADSTLSVAVDAGSLGVAVSTAGTTVTLAPSGGATAILAGGTVTGNLGSTEVTDTRGTSTGWTANIAASHFSSGTASIDIGNASVTVAALANTTLPATCGVGGVVTFPAAAQALTTTAAQLAKCAAPLNAVVGANSAKWGNSVSLTIPSTAPSGTYKSTVTQSVQ